jgi:plastocyanin
MNNNNVPDKMLYMYYRISSRRTIISSGIIILTIAMSIIVLTDTAYSQGGIVNSTTSNNNNSSIGTTSAPSGAIKVSIQPGAATLATKAFFPNPVNVKVGDTITWTNNDNSSPAFHTVTSGLGPNDTNLGKVFDSGLSGSNALTAQGKTFSHTFTIAGEFQYFCQLHPTMLGKVIVSK